MRQLTPMFLVLGFVAAAPAGAEPAEPSPAPAKLHFVSDSPYLVGTVFGIEAVDASHQPIGGRIDVAIEPGMRTVWYSCPNAPAQEGGLRLSHSFEPGQQYELVCQQGMEATIRDMESC